MERIRLRLTFEEPHILSDLQKSEGLRCSWFLLKPQLHTTISLLSSHILTTFQLQHSCPHGLLLSMDGFLLPPFESTCILKDKCIVRNKKHCSEVAEKTSKSQQDLTGKKNLCKQKKKVADPDSKDVDNIKGSAESSKVNNSIVGMKKNNEFQEKGVGNVEAITKPERVKKGPSRSARKQYAKRQWLREIIKIYKNVASETEGLANAGRRAGNLHSKWHVNGETDSRPKGRWNWKQQQSKDKYPEVIGQPKGLLHWKQSREEDEARDTNRQEQANEKSTLCEKTGQQCDMEDEIVPGDQALQQDQLQEVDFSSVLEVRVVENGTSDSVAGLSGQPSEGPATNKSNPVLIAGEKKADGPAIENGGVNIWEQHSETIKATNGQLYNVSSWGTWSSGKKSSWSERALRGSARGPTTAFRRYKK